MGLSETAINGTGETVHSTSWSGSFNGHCWQIHCDDATSALRHMKDGSFDCVVTSPPYFWLRDYGMDSHIEIGREATVEGYVDRLCEVLDEVHRVLRRDGLLFLNLGDTYYSGKGQSGGVDQKSSKRRFGLRAVDRSGGLGIGLQRKSLIGIPWRVGLELVKRDWVLRSTIIWHRENCLPEPARDRPSRSYEYILMCAKDRHYHFDKQPLVDQRVDEDMWTVAARPKSAKLKTAPFPDELVRRCLQIGCRRGGTVLDPFAGTGTTVRVALSDGFDAVGVDLSQDFCEYAVQQLKKLRK